MGLKGNSEVNIFSPHLKYVHITCLEHALCIDAFVEHIISNSKIDPYIQSSNPKVVKFLTKTFNLMLLIKTTFQCDEGWNGCSSSSTGKCKRAVLSNHAKLSVKFDRSAVSETADRIELDLHSSFGENLTRNSETF